MSSTYDQAREKIYNYKYQEAWELYQQGIEEGDIKCLFGQATMIMEGLYVEKDIEKANSIFNRCFSDLKILAETDIQAAYIMSFYYRGGYGDIAQNAELYFKYSKISAEGGILPAMYNVAYCYKMAIGTELSYDNAFEWYKKAAEGGDIEAQFQLAYLYASS